MFYFYGFQIYYPITSCSFPSGVDFQSTDTSTRTTRSRLSGTEDFEVAQRIIEEESTQYHCISFKKFRTSHQGLLMKSKQCEKCLVLCRANNLFLAGWMLCPYIFKGNCASSRGMFPISTKKGGTNRFGFRMRTHECCNFGSVTSFVNYNFPSTCLVVYDKSCHVDMSTSRCEIKTPSRYW